MSDRQAYQRGFLAGSAGPLGLACLLVGGLVVIPGVLLVVGGCVLAWLDRREWQ